MLSQQAVNLVMFCLCISSGFSVIIFERGYVQRPPYWKKAEMTRYIVHACDWGAISTLSTLPGHQGAPFTNVISVSDGPVDNGTGENTKVQYNIVTFRTILNLLKYL